MSTFETGGSAYPKPPECQTSGLDKREYFAARALQGFLANPKLCSAFDEIDALETVDIAYVIADAMLERY